MFGKNIKKGEEGHIGGVVFKRGVKPSAHYADKMEVIRLDDFPRIILGSEYGVMHGY